MYFISQVATSYAQPQQQQQTYGSYDQSSGYSQAGAQPATQSYGETQQTGTTYSGQQSSYQQQSYATSGKGEQPARTGPLEDL